MNETNNLEHDPPLTEWQSNPEHSLQTFPEMQKGLEERSQELELQAEAVTRFVNEPKGLHDLLTYMDSVLVGTMKRYPGRTDTVLPNADAS